ncbi:MAG: glycosyltransferase [Usitatibacter sp.]
MHPESLAAESAATDQRQPDVQKPPRVSIIMNVRNGAAYVRDALDSVLAQSFKDWELVFWDNASTDETGAIAHAFGDPRMRYFRSPELMPLGRARTLAIRQARGEWLAFLDHDDVWLPQKLEMQLALDDPGVAIIYGRAVSFSAGGRERDFDHRHEFDPLPQGELFDRLFNESCFISMSSAMMRRSAVDEAGTVPDWVELITDYYLHLELSHRRRVRAVQSVVCRYRLHPKSLSRTGAVRMHNEALWLIDRWKDTVGPVVAQRRRRVHLTALAVEEMRVPGSRVTGLARLFREGSLPFLLSRPFVWAFREARRRIHRPNWAQDGSEPVWSGAPTPLADVPLTLTVIVVNWKVREYLRDCLRSLYDQMQLPQAEWELIVVDNDSGDGSVEMVRDEFPMARLIANQDNVGFGRANDQAFAMGRGRYVLLLNPDTLVLDHAIDRMLEVMERGNEIGVLGCRLLNTDGSFQRWTGGNPPRLLNVACNFLLLNRIVPEALLPPPLYLESEPSRDVEVGWVSGACLLLRRAALRTTIFDERFFLYGEDLELCDRLRLGEWKVMYTPSATVIHHQGRSLVQQTVEVQQFKMRGLRAVFAMRNRALLLPAFDAMLLVGFSVRTVLFGIAAVFRPGRDYAERAAVSRRCMVEAFRALLGVDQPVGAAKGGNDD